MPRVSLSSSLPLATFAGLLDLKLGSEIITYFVILNKVAGLYGLVLIFFGGNLAQLSLYLYSVAGLAVCAWGLRQIGEENTQNALLYAHAYLFDHAISTLWTVFFAVDWYVYNPHDGKRPAGSRTAREMLEGHGRASTGIDDPGRLGDTGESEAERARKAIGVWNDEKGFATAVLVLGWLLKIYFILVLYSYAIHLRRGTFRQLLSSQQAAKAANLPASRRPSQAANSNSYSYSHLRNTSTASTANGEVVWDPEDGEDDVEGQRTGQRERN